MSDDLCIKFEKLQDEIIALSVLANAARQAETAHLLGYDWQTLIEPILPMIAKRAGDMCFVSDVLSATDHENEDRRIAIAEGKRVIGEQMRAGAR